MACQVLSGECFDRAEELFYLNDGAVMAVPIETEAGFRSGTPQPLFEAAYEAQVYPGFDVSRDGQQFLMPKRNEGGTTELIVVENWFEELQRLVPTD